MCQLIVLPAITAVGLLVQERADERAERESMAKDAALMALQQVMTDAVINRTSHSLD